MTRPAVVLLSGGLDSATTLAMARAEGCECYALSFAYGQRHSAELVAAARVATALGAREHRGAGMSLNNRPHWLLGEIPELAAGPVAVLALDEAIVEVANDRTPLECSDRISRGHRALERRADDAGNADVGKTLGKLRIWERELNVDLDAPAFENPEAA